MKTVGVLAVAVALGGCANAAGARAERSAQVGAMTASWLPWRKRVLLDHQCALDERDLPPP